jgi:hypothetical protein
LGLGARHWGSLPAHTSYRSAHRDACAADGHSPSGRLNGLGKMYVHGAGSLLSLLDLKGHTLSLAQRFEGRAFDARAMEEDLAPIIGRDKAKPALLHHPLDFARCHDVALSGVKLGS